jgi:hypothetical protein
MRFYLIFSFSSWLSTLHGQRFPGIGWNADKNNCQLAKGEKHVPWKEMSERESVKGLLENCKAGTNNRRISFYISEVNERFFSNT